MQSLSELRAVTHHINKMMACFGTVCTALSTIQLSSAEVQTHDQVVSLYLLNEQHLT